MATVTKDLAANVLTFQSALETKRPSLLKMAPQGFDPEALIDRVKAQASMILLKKPDLAECDLASFVMAVTNVVELGLDLAGPLPTAYIVPFKEDGQKKAQAMIAYTGLRELAVRSGCVKTIQAEVVHEHDKFDWKHTHGGLEFSHVYPWEGRGKIVGFYAHAVTPNGFPLGCRMSKAQVDAIRDASPAYKFGRSPWKLEPNGYIQMGCKTLIRRMSKSLTLSPIMQRAVEIMDETEGGLDAGDTVAKTRREVLQAKLMRVEGPSAPIVAESPAIDTSAPAPSFDPAEIAAEMEKPKKGKKPVFDLDGNPVA